MRYVLASAVALLIFFAGALFVWQTQRHMQLKLERAVQEAKDSGQLPAETSEPGAIDYTGLGMEVSSSEMSRIALADLLARFWFILLPLLIVICLGIAKFTQGKPHP